ncbi:MAG: hypothetical protein HY868_06105 [Chloroflexi bacterium]|nr:hypothetical protein [Chloroflexota bacterium]
MPIDLKDMPRPPSDNGRGLHGSLNADWSGGEAGYDFWINELIALGIKWFKVVDDHGSSIPFCEKLLAAGIFPIVRILRRDPPPNDSPEPNPGHLGRAEEETIRKLIALGVRYFETNNEPNRSIEWKHSAMPPNALEAAKLVALNWLFDARVILEAGGLPGLPAISGGGNLDVMGALAALGRQKILLEGCWIALHNAGMNRPLEFPEHPVNHLGQPLTREQYEHGAFTEWAWWNNSQNRAESRDEINALRAARLAPTQTIQQEHACFREFEYYNALAMKYLGRSIPIISTEGGYQIGRRDYPRYPRVTPALQRDLTVAMFDWMQRQAPDYYFAATACALVGTLGREQDAWYGAYWRDAFQNGTDGFDGFPKIAVPRAEIGECLPVVDAVKAMPNLARRLPGMQPTPPIAVQPSKPPAPPEKRIERPGLANLFSDVPLPPTPTRASQPSVEPKPRVVESSIELPPPSHAAEPSIAPVESPVELPPPPRAVEPSIAPVESPIELPPQRAAEPGFAPIESQIGPQVSVPEPPPLIEEIPDETLPVEATDEPVEIVAPMPEIERVELPFDVEWDFRLDALNVSVELAETRRGETYWRLVSAVYEGPGESGDSHHIFYTVLDELQQPVAHQRVWQGWSDNQTDAVTNDRGETTIPLWQSFTPNDGETGPYTAWIEGLPCDRVIGLGLPLKRHVNFRVTWRRSVSRK